MTSSKPTVEINKDFCSFITKTGNQCKRKPSKDPLTKGCCMAHYKITKNIPEPGPSTNEKTTPTPKVEINKDFCSSITKAGTQCKLKPDTDELAKGCCFRHRVVYREVEINKNFCSFIYRRKQCNLKPDTDELAKGCCFVHRVIKRDPTKVEINKNFCSFISGGKQCNMKPDTDELAKGLCFIHRLFPQNTETKEQRQERYNQEDINKEKHTPKGSEKKPSNESWWKEAYESLFKPKARAPPQQPPKARAPPQLTATQILKDRALTTEKEWKQWIVRNHPDKGGEPSMFIEVLKAGRIVFDKS